MIARMPKEAGFDMAGPSPSRDKLDQVQSELEKQIKKFGKRRKRDKRKAFGLKVSTVVLSATITVLLGLRNFSHDAEAVFANIALGLGALVTVLAAIDAFFTHRGLWILRTKTVRQLEAISSDLEYYKCGLTGEPEAAQVDKFHERLCLAIKQDLEAWDKLRAGES